MLKYLKYYLSTLLLLTAIFLCFNGKLYPTFYFLLFSIIIIAGDIFFKKDTNTDIYRYPILINLPIYLNLPLLFIFVMGIIFTLSNQDSNWFSSLFSIYLNVNLIDAKNSMTLADNFSLVALGSLYIGIMGTVPGHELTHRKKDKIDMFLGNWLLALSWDCAFAIEHVYGHHKHVGLPNDPATAKRGENIYLFILRAIVIEQRDAWLIELDHLKRRKQKPFGFKNKMLIGYFRSLIITLVAYIVGGLLGMLFYLVCAFIAKALLEIINYVEHYGLVREPDKPVFPRHSWNSNNVLSSILLYNVTRHSAHHEKSNLKFWELKSYPDAPMMPYGYLSMLYIAALFPFLYHKIMKSKLADWDKNYASNQERNIINNS